MKDGDRGKWGGDVEMRRVDGEGKTSDGEGRMEDRERVR